MSDLAVIVGAAKDPRISPFAVAVRPTHPTAGAIMIFLSQLAQDARYTLRQLRRNPFFSLTVIATVALALGATAALAGVLRATLLNPLPYAHAEQLVRIDDHALRGPKSAGFLSVARAGELASFAPGGQPLFSSLGYFYSDDSSLAFDGHEPIRVPAVAVSGGFFPTLATQPLLGRTILPADDVRNGPQTLVISRSLWQTAFAADPNIIGRIVQLGKQPAIIIGVMDSSFAYPAGVDLWHPGNIFPADFSAEAARGDGSRWIAAIARTEPGATLLQVRQEAALLARSIAQAHPATDGNWDFNIVPLRDSLFGIYRKALLLLAVAVGLVLVLAAINIAGLQLSRNAGRQPEFAVRSALGVTRGRLTQQLLTESLLLALAGSLLGVALAEALLKLLASRLPATLLQAQTPHVDRPVLLLALAVACLVGLVTAALPAWQSTRLSSNRTTIQTGQSGRTRLFGRGFTVLQIALSLVLLGISASVLTNLYQLVNTPLGFLPSQLETFSVDLPWGNYGPPTHQLYTSLERQFLSIPGVTAAGTVTALPLTGVYSFRNTFDIVGQAPTPQHDTVVAEGRSISPGYLGVMHIPLLGGRNFSPHDADPGVPPTLIVNQAFVHKYFPDESPLGHHLLSNNNRAGTLQDSGEIVGIVGDVRGSGGSLAVPTQPEVFSPETGGWPHMQFALRVSQPLANHNPALEANIRRIVRSSSSIASAGHFATLSSTVDKTLAQPRLNAGLLTAFGALSLLLVVIGVYGLVAFDVAQRTRELGLRIALGSSRAGVLTLLLSESSRVLAAGLALGVLASFACAKVLDHLVTGTASQSLALTLFTTTLLALAVLAATWLPARRASRIDPMEALKAT